MDKTSLIFKDNFLFDIERNEIKSYIGADVNVIIPETIGGTEVKRIAAVITKYSQSPCKNGLILL